MSNQLTHNGKQISFSLVENVWAAGFYFANILQAMDPYTGEHVSMVFPDCAEDGTDYWAWMMAEARKYNVNDWTVTITSVKK